MSGYRIHKRINDWIAIEKLDTDKGDAYRVLMKVTHSEWIHLPEIYSTEEACEKAGQAIIDKHKEKRIE